LSETNNKTFCWAQLKIPYFLYFLSALGEAQSSQITFVNASFRASIKSSSHSSKISPSGVREAFLNHLMPVCAEPQ
jgi:hypothetical protein